MIDIYKRLLLLLFFCAMSILKLEANATSTPKPTGKIRSYPSMQSEGLIGVTEASPIDNPVDNIFHVVMNESLCGNEKIWLTYELEGVADHTSVSRSINDQVSVGGYLVKRRRGWAVQREQISAAWLKEGDNVVRFTMPENAMHSYRIRNLKIEVEPSEVNADEIQVIFNQPSTHYYFGKAYIKGIVTGAEGIVRINIDGKEARMFNGEFESVIDFESGSQSCIVEVEAEYPDGSTTCHSVSFTEPQTVDFTYSLENYTYKKEQFFHGKEVQSIALHGAALTTTEGALMSAAALSVTTLRAVDIAPLDAGMENVTRHHAGFRFLPHGTVFNKEVNLRVPYDAEKIPDGYTEADIRTYYFDEQSHHWVPLKLDTVLAETAEVLSQTLHFTDYINAIIKVPESPEVEAYNSTSMKGIKAANPTAAVNLINPPQANNTGSASLSYPINIPAGRGGMQPQLSISYNSSGGNGWMGLGWNLSLPMISIDTRWGVPRYDAEKETETYTFNGEQLSPVAHRGELVDRSTGNKQFHPRIEGSFNRIIRHGTHPSAYWWEVTDKSGTKYFYGSDGNEVDASTTLTDAAGNIGYWALRKVVDLNGNFVQYNYDKILDDSAEPGTHFYIREILYTGHTSAAPRYKVVFSRETGRSDVIIAANLGFKQVTADRLKKIEVQYDGDNIRYYVLNYKEGAFFKSLLQSIQEFDAADVLFTTHTFDYYDEVDFEGGYKPFDASTAWNVGEDGAIRGDFKKRIEDTFDDNASMLSGTKSKDRSMGMAVTVGFNVRVFDKTLSVGGSFNSATSESESVLTMVDLNGDGLADKVFMKGDRMYYRPNLSGPSTREQTFGPDKEIKYEGSSISTFFKEKSKTKSGGLEAHGPASAPVFGGYSKSKTRSQQSVYFTEVNGDQLPDLVQNGAVLFMHINPETGDPEFVNSSDQTPSRIFQGSNVAQGMSETDDVELQKGIRENPLHDVVKMWEAPYTGRVKVTGTVQLLEIDDEDRAETQVDGVRVAIQLKGVERWSQAITATDYNVYTPGNVSDLSVNKGDRIYFRVGSMFEGSYDQVAWQPVVEYVSLPFSFAADANGESYIQYDSKQDFKLSAIQKVSPPEKGRIKIESKFIKPATSDDVQLEIIRETTSEEDGADPNHIIATDTLWIRKYASDTVVNIDTVFEFDVEKGHHFRFKVHSNTNVNWAAVNWTTRMYYSALTDDQFKDQELFDTEGKPLIEFYPIPEYTMYNHELQISQPYKIYGTTDTVTINVKPVLEFREPSLTNPFGFDGTVYFTLKKENELLWKDTLVVENNEVVSAINSSTIKVLKNDSVFVEYHMDSRDLANGVQIAKAELTVNDTIKDLSAGVHTVIEEKMIFGPMYHQWGHFAYHANDRENTAISETDLKIDGDDIKNRAPKRDPKDFEDGNDLQDGNSYKPYDEKFVILVPIGKDNIWLGYDNETYVSATGISSSRMGDNDPQASATSAQPGTGAKAINKMTESTSDGYSLGASAGFLGASATWSDGTTKVVSDFMDFNGDRYPDVVVGNKVQFTNARGGLSNSVFTHGDKYNMHSTNDAKGFSLSGSVTTSKGEGGLSWNIKKAQVSIGDGKGSAGLSANKGSGNNYTDFSWIDINGDGLPDRVSKSGTVQLNLGYRFGEEETWGQSAVQNGKSSNEGAGLGISLWNGSISGGISLARSDNEVSATLQDVNGDGLVDIVSYQEEQPLKVQFNKGNGFGPLVEWKGAFHAGSSSSTSQSANIAFTAGIYIPVVNIKITVNPSYSEGRGASRELAKLTDVNGDGFPDYVTSKKYDHLNVSLSTIGRTNMLKSVKRPLGAAFALSYKRIGNTYEMPTSTWALDSVTTFDGFEGDGVDSMLVTYSYEGGRYERHEREFYGFRKVITNTHDTKENDKPVYTTVTQTFSNDNYYTKGLLLSEVMTDGAENKFVEKENIYLLKNILNGEELTSEGKSSDSGNGFPALVETRQKFYEGQSEPGKHTHVTYEYDTLGNVITYTDFGDEGDEDDLSASISYHRLENLHVLATPKMITVTGSGITYRKRESVVDPNTGKVTNIKQFLSGNDASHHDMEYDEFGNLKKISRPKNAKDQRLTFDYQYEEEVHTYPIKVRNSYGYSSEATYDFRFGQKLSSKDLNGNEITYGLDNLGRVIKITGPYEKGGSGYTIKFEYHPEAVVPWALTKHFDPSNPKNDILTSVFVDGLGRILQTKKDVAIYAGDGKADTEMMSVSGRVKFDAFGRPVEALYPVVEPVGAAGEFNFTEDGEKPTLTTYDVMNRTLSVTLPDLSVAETTYGFENDREGKKQFSTKTTDANANQTEQFTDVRGRITSVKNYTSDRPVWTSFRYNAVNEKIEAIDDLGNATLSAYDNFGRRISRVHPDAGTTTYSYDLAGNMTELVTANLAKEGLAIMYTYDFERLVEITYPQNTENNVKYIYGEAGSSDNRAGRIVLQEDATGAQEFFYGPFGEIVKNIRTIVIPQHDEQTHATEWEYDTWNRLVSMTYADGEKVTYNYNAGGLLRSMTGKKKNAIYNYVDQLGYDKFEQRLFLAYGNGTKTTYSYESDRRRLKNMSATTSARRLFMDNTYNYDKVNNILSLTNNAPIPSANLMGGASDYSYGYDDLYRLTSAQGSYKGSNDQHTYTLSINYNSVGGITQKTQVHKRKDQEQKKTTYDLSYTYGDTQPHAPVHIGEQTYTYDANGNQKGWTSDVSGQRRTVLWDEENHVRAIYDNGSLHHYIYDAAGERVLKGKSTGQRIFVNGEWKAGSGQMGNYTVYVNPYLVLRSGGYTKHYYIEGQRIVSKLGGGLDNNGKGPLRAGGDKIDYVGKSGKVFDGIVKNLKFLGADGQILTAGKSGKIPPGQINGTSNVTEAFRYFFHPDHVGSTSYVTDASGEVFQHLEYFAFGETFVEEHSNTNRTPYLFNGKELDDETGLYYYGARYYDPKTSVWQSVDPLSEKHPGMSSYAYTGNNPIVFFDPDGRDWFNYQAEGDEKASWHWHEGSTYNTGKKDDVGNDIILTGSEAVVIFRGSRDEKLGEGSNLYGEGAQLAEVMVLGPDGSDDIEFYEGYTMSSDPSKYGRVADGTYDANYDAVGKSGSLKSNWTLNERGAVPAQDNVNPNMPNQIDSEGNAYLLGIFIHRSNKDGFAGSPVSKGCLLIAPGPDGDEADWTRFNNQMSGVQNFKVEVDRSIQERKPRFKQ